MIKHPLPRRLALVAASVAALTASFAAQARHALLRPQPLHETVHLRFEAGQKQIDALGGQQDGAFELPGICLVATPLTPNLGRRQGRE